MYIKKLFGTPYLLSPKGTHPQGIVFPKSVGGIKLSLFT